TLSDPERNPDYRPITPDEMTPPLVVQAYGEALADLLHPSGRVSANHWPGVEGADGLPLKARALLDELGGRLTAFAWYLCVLEEPERTQILALLEDVQALRGEAAADKGKPGRPPRNDVFVQFAREKQGRNPGMKTQAILNSFRKVRPGHPL